MERFAWTWFATLTTPYELTLPSARRLVERTSREWQRLDPTVRVFWVAEKFEVKDGYHLHALIYARNHEQNFKRMIDIYQAMARGRLLKYEDGKEVRRVDQERMKALPAVPSYESGPAVCRSGVRPSKKMATDGSPLPGWCRIELQRFDKRLSAGRYLVKYLFKEQSRGRGADWDWVIPSPRNRGPVNLEV